LVFGIPHPVKGSAKMDAGAWSCGIVVGLIHDIPTVKELFAALRESVVGTDAKCRPRRAMSECEGKAEDICSLRVFRSLTHLGVRQEAGKE
jgi:hypothetical protein